MPPRKAHEPRKGPRRPRGAGGLSQRKSNGLWIGCYLWEDEYGEKHRAYSGTSKDKVIANQNLRDMITKIESGTYMPQSGMTVSKWLEYWAEEIVKPSKKPKTYASYRGAVDNQIIPIIGDRKLPITPAVARGMLKKVREGWSERTAELTYTVLNTALKAAVSEQVIKANPLEHIVKPKVTPSTDGKALTSDEARRVLLSAMQGKDPMVTRWAAAFLLGCRQGELLGLEWDRVDLENLTVDLCWQLQSLTTKPGCSLEDPDRFEVPAGFELRPLYRRFALTRPKSETSKRLTPIPVPLAAILKTYQQTAEHNEYGLVWSTGKGKPIPARYDSGAWHAALARAEVRQLPLHAARHTTATLLQEMGVEESVRMQIIGHNTVATQRRYAHVDLSAARRALGNLDGLLKLE